MPGIFRWGVERTLRTEELLEGVGAGPFTERGCHCPIPKLNLPLNLAGRPPPNLCGGTRNLPSPNTSYHETVCVRTIYKNLHYQ